MSKVLHAGTICRFSSLDNYPTETGSGTSSSLLLRSSQHSIIWALADLLTEANRAEALDERNVQLPLEFKE